MDSSASFVGNRYWVLRHGKSIPNERGLIVSSMENGLLPKYQLAPDGVAQAQLAGQSFLKQLQESNISLDKVSICYSPFSRTTHTAKVVAQVLNLPFDSPHCKMMEALRERYFGPTFELKSHDKKEEKVLMMLNPDLPLPGIHGSRISKVRHSGGESWRSSADVAEHFPFSKAT